MRANFRFGCLAELATPRRRKSAFRPEALSPRPPETLGSEGGRGVTSPTLLVTHMHLVTRDGPSLGWRLRPRCGAPQVRVATSMSSAEFVRRARQVAWPTVGPSLTRFNLRRNQAPSRVTKYYKGFRATYAFSDTARDRGVCVSRLHRSRSLAVTACPWVAARLPRQV